MNEKQRRHRKILELISSQSIGRQETLGEALRDVGIRATQSTLSKDIRELGVLKVPNSNGESQYQASSRGRITLQGDELLRRELTDFVHSVDGAGHTLVVKTITGHAQGVCESIDQAGWREIVGTIAGENTIFLLCQSEDDRTALQARIQEIVEA